MSDQNYASHRRFVTGYHIVLSGLVVLTLIGSLVNLYKSWGDETRLLSASLIVAGALASNDFTPVHHDKAAAQAMLNELVLKAEREAAGQLDPFE